MKRTYIYWTGAALIIIAIVVVSGLVIVNKRSTQNGADASQTNVSANDGSSKPIKSGDVKTPTDNKELSNALDSDASSIDDALKNNENSDYDDATLNDNSLYN